MDTNNAIVKHSLDLNPNINIDNNLIIFRENDDNKRKIIESIIISKTNTFNINQQNYNIDKFSSHIIDISISMETLPSIITID